MAKRVRTVRLTANGIPVTEATVECDISTGKIDVIVFGNTLDLPPGNKEYIWASNSSKNTYLKEDN